ncbi:XdhC family aldehyde oxidoreductase maturation factor [Clostridium autoethanogenum]|uniref:XdhC family protein n=1 Tax=Clostridium autoethanogenum DSM 10061 TaxID=1341692 RepID=A0ABN4BH66_9CLOT|nr:XdhC/CoxI family protein [Clostridium autoethanogenum]AGY76975.1 XdhC family protein [Clostridium autoethanogenum DSM 10061]ALU37118.1 XshC-Cox1-family protein [Clostridium autoethanogenum DSM 10061]OVY50309.1 putative xanthine dehydrogenase subunit A [Clostridium autoethanogenum]
MEKIYKEVVKLLQKEESFVIATIFDKTGSAPRTAGAKMVVRNDGSIIGTIGGGRLEADAIGLAKKSLSLKQTVMQSFDLTHNDVASMDMICGGKGEILIDFIDAQDENNRIIYETVVKIQEKREKAWFITVLDNVSGTSNLRCQQCIVKPDKTLIGKIDCDPNILEKLIAGPAKISIHAEVIDNQRFLVEPLRPEGTVYIFGAGHVSQRIAPLSETVGFRTVVLDDREEYANRSRFSEPTELMVIDSFNKLPNLHIDEDSYLVIVTRGHLYDRVVLEQVLRSNAKYIGMIGSKSKRDKIFTQLLNQGYAKEEIRSVYSPIGTSIGAETPQEIAVSIVGELIKVRSEGEKTNSKKSGNTSDIYCNINDPD